MKIEKIDLVLIALVILIVVICLTANPYNTTG